MTLFTVTYGQMPDRRTVHLTYTLASCGNTACALQNSSNLQASSMQLRKLQILKQQGKVAQLHRRDERSLIVDAITTARPDTKTAAYDLFLLPAGSHRWHALHPPLYRRNMTCITAPPVDDCKAYRFLHSVKGQQQQKLPSAVHSIINLSIERLALFFSCGA